MSLSDQVRALKIHLERSLDAVNKILDLICTDLDSDEEVSSESDYASSDENEMYLPPAPMLVRSETYIDNPVDRPGTPEMLPPKVYKKIKVERFDE